MAKRKYYRLDGTIEDTDQEKTNESLESINKRMQLEKPALAKVAETVKPIQTTVQMPQTPNVFEDKTKQMITYQPQEQRKIDEANDVGWKELGYIGKKTGSGLLSGGTGILDVPLQEAQKDLKEGAQRDLSYYGTTKPLLDVARVLAPHIVMPIEHISKDIERQKQGMNIGQRMLASISDTKDMFAGSGIQALKEATKMYGTVDKDASNKVAKLSDALNKPAEDFRESLAKEGQQYGKVPNAIANAFEQVGHMAPSIATSAITKDPNLGLGVMAASARGSSTREALNKGATIEEAINIGDAKALTEILTEKITGGVNFLGKGALDDITTKLLNDKVKQPILNFLAKEGVKIGGEVLEELISNVVDNAIDKTTLEPNKEIFSKEETLDTIVQTILSTVLLNGLTGSYGPSAYNNNKLELQQIEANKNAVQGLGDTYKQSSIDRIREGTGTNNDEIREAANRFNLGKLEQNNVDNSTNIAYNESTNAKEGVNNEFRNIQEESRRKLSEESWGDSSKAANEDLRGRLRGAFTEELERRGYSNSNNDGVLNLEGKGNQFNLYKNVDADTFHDIFESARANTDNGELVDLHPVNSTKDQIGYADTNNYISDDGMQGFAITKDGDVISVFNADPYKSGFLRSINNEINTNGKTLDCYNSNKQALNEIYEKVFGWKTPSVMDYNMEYDHDNIAQNHGNPDVSFMVNPNQLKADVTDADLNKRFGKDQYDEAAAYRNALMKDGTGNKSDFIFDENGKFVKMKDGTSDSSFNLAENREQDKSIKVKTTGKEGQQYFEEQGATEKVAKILSEVPKESKITKEDVSNVAGSIYRNIVSKGGELEKLSKELNKPNVNYTYDKMLRAPAEAQQHIGTAQTDLNYKPYKNFTDANGKKVSMSLNDIRNDVKNSGISEQTLNEYLGHKLNEYRYIEGKPVFSKNITSEMSTEICNEIEKQNPQIKRVAENVWQFEQNQLKNLYDSGLISEERYNNLSKNKHYVRIQRQMPKNRGTKITTDRNGKVQISQPIQTAKGGNQDIMPIMEGIAKHTSDLIKLERTNESMRELGKALSMGSTDENIDAFTDEESFGVNPDLIKDNEDGTYSMTYFENGIPTVVPINKGIYDAYVKNKAVSYIEGSKPFKLLAYTPKKMSQIFRGLTTNNNPLFMVTNFFKDIGDAPFNSKHLKEFTKTYLSTEALRQVAGNGVYNQLYNAAGGGSDSYFVDGNFTDKQGNKLTKGLKKLWSPVEKGNEIVESVPRVAEFIATIKANGYEVNANGELVAQKGVKITKSANEVLNEALYNAAEITTNFKRGGDVSKFLNRNGATFLNASIQGFDKQIRNFKDAFTSGDKKQIVKLLTKALIFGIAPTMLNDAMNDDDDEYKEMQEYQKDNYYLFKGKDGKWIRIPKGRAMSVLGSTARRTKNFLKGDKNAYSGLVQFASNQVAPNSIFENNILAPFSQVKNNKSWSGNAIINQSMLKKASNEQYNEKTDAFSKWLGNLVKDIPISKEAKKEGYGNFKSPMAINYLLDQYTGVIGDVFLPMTAPKATSGDNPLIAPITSKFTADAAYSNKSVGDFYDLKDEIDETSSKDTNLKKVQRKYMNSMNSQLSGLYKEQHEIQNNPDLSKKEKYKQAREKQEEINKVAKEVVNNVKNAKEKDGLIKMGNTYYTVSQDDKGAEKIKPITKENMKSIKEANIPVEEFAMVDAIITEMSADKNSQGKTISGSKKKKAINFLEEAGYDDNQIKAIVEAQGWKY